MELDVPVKELRPNGYASATCPKCVFYDRCGGLHNNRPLFNCFEQFCCGDGSCDHVCPYKTDDFQRRMREIGGLRFDDIPALHQSPIALPPYVPMIHHASRRAADLMVEAVALDPYLIFRRRNGEYRSLADDGAALRRKFKIAPTSKIILRGTAEDRFLENYRSGILPRPANERSRDVPSRFGFQDEGNVTDPVGSSGRRHLQWQEAG